jgi:hypothetical protein
MRQHSYILLLPLFPAVLSVGEEEGRTFFSRASALDVGGICAAFGLEKNDASQLLIYFNAPCLSWRC